MAAGVRVLPLLLIFVCCPILSSFLLYPHLSLRIYCCEYSAILLSHIHGIRIFALTCAFGSHFHVAGCTTRNSIFASFRQYSNARCADVANESYNTPATAINVYDVEGPPQAAPIPPSPVQSSSLIFLRPANTAKWRSSRRGRGGSSLLLLLLQLAVALCRETDRPSQLVRLARVYSRTMTSVLPFRYKRSFMDVPSNVLRI